MGYPNTETTRFFVGCIAFLVVLAFSAPLFAGQNLLRELPDGHDTLIVVDFSQMQSSPLYDQAFDIISEHPALKGFLTYLESDLGIDARTDLEALTVVSDTPPLSAALLSQPLAVLEDGGPAAHSEGTLIVVRGNFDASRVLEKIASDDSNEVQGDRFRNHMGELRALGEKTLAISLGSDDFVDSMSSRLSADRNGPGSIFTGGIQRLGPSQGLYFMIRPTIDSDAELETEPSFAALSIDLKENVRVALLVDLPSEEAAEEMVEEMDQLRRQMGGNPLLGMFGARPLVDNLSIRQDGKQFTMRSSMTNDQALRLARRLNSVAQSSQDLSQPLGGDDRDGGSDTQQKKPADDGVDADFN